MFAAQVLQFVCLKQTKCFWYNIYIRESDLCRHSEASITMAKASCSHSVINLIENLFRSQSGGGGTWEASSILSPGSLSTLHSEFENIDSPHELRLCWITMVLGLLETSPVPSSQQSLTVTNALLVYSWWQQQWHKYEIHNCYWSWNTNCWLC